MKKINHNGRHYTLTKSVKVSKTLILFNKEESEAKIERQRNELKQLQLYSNSKEYNESIIKLSKKVFKPFDEEKEINTPLRYFGVVEMLSMLTNNRKLTEITTPPAPKPQLKLKRRAIVYSNNEMLMGDVDQNETRRHLNL